MLLSRGSASYKPELTSQSTADSGTQLGPRIGRGSAPRLGIQ